VRSDASGGLRDDRAAVSRKPSHYGDPRARLEYSPALPPYTIVAALPDPPDLGDCARCYHVPKKTSRSKGHVVIGQQYIVDAGATESETAVRLIARFDIGNLGDRAAVALVADCSSARPNVATDQAARAHSAQPTSARVGLGSHTGMGRGFDGRRTYHRRELSIKGYLTAASNEFQAAARDGSLYLDNGRTRHERRR